MDWERRVGGQVVIIVIYFNFDHFAISQFATLQHSHLGCRLLSLSFKLGSFRLVPTGSGIDMFHALTSPKLIRFLSSLERNCQYHFHLSKSAKYCIYAIREQVEK